VNAHADFRPDLAAGALNAAGVHYVIVGGIAVAAHGVVRATADMDIVADPDPANMQTLARALSAMGGEHPVDAVLTGEALARPAPFKVQTRNGDVQVLNRLPGVPAYQQLAREAIDVDVGGGILAPVCSLCALRAMKLRSGRPRDLVDLSELDELHPPG
jgi:hypothetical protein